MPEIFRFAGTRFFFFSDEHLPIRIHVKNSDGTAKFTINPVQLIDSTGMKNKDLNIVEDMIRENEDLIELRWKEYFG